MPLCWSRLPSEYVVFLAVDCGYLHDCINCFQAEHVREKISVPSLGAKKLLQQCWARGFGLKRANARIVL
jgi:hypothetical protein